MEVEAGFPIILLQGSRKKGHDVRITLEANSFGRGQIIWRDPKTGELSGGAESRTDDPIAYW